LAQHETPTSLFTDLVPEPTPIARKDHLTFRANRTRGRHGWLRLTPAYSVHLVEELIRQGGPQTRVLDPFCGTGTTALVCAEANIPCDTVDINPFLVWLANTKCTNYTAEDIAAAHATLQRALEMLARPDTRTSVEDPAWVPPIKDITKWWDAKTLALLAQVFECLEAAPIPDAAHNLLRVLFCRSAIDCASVSFGHQSMSFKKPSTAPTLFEVGSAERLSALLSLAGADVLQAVRSPIPAGRGTALLGDSRDLLRVLPRADYTTVVTSPPYPNRMSYIRELRPYMYWLGYLTTGRQAGELDWQAIGGTWGIATSYLTTWTPAQAYEIPEAAFREAVERITQRSKVLGAYVTKYFQDIVPHIQSVRAVIAPGATVHYVVGNSKFYDVMLHTEQIYAAILRDQGFQDVQITNIRKRTSKKELFEYVVSAHA
jgi:hypothetical protein